MNKFVSEDILRPLLYAGKNLAEREGFVFKYSEYLPFFHMTIDLDYELNISKIQKNILLLLLHMMLFVVIRLSFRMYSWFIK